VGKVKWPSAGIGVVKGELKVLQLRIMLEGVK